MSDQPSQQEDPQTHPAAAEENAPEIVPGESEPRFDVEHGAEVPEEDATEVESGDVAGDHGDTSEEPHVDPQDSPTE